MKKQTKHTAATKKTAAKPATPKKEVKKKAKTATARTKDAKKPAQKTKKQAQETQEKAQPQQAQKPATQPAADATASKAEAKTAEQPKPEESLKPYQNAEEYLEDVLCLFSSTHPNFDATMKQLSPSEKDQFFCNQLAKIEKRCQNSTAKIPFEEELKKFRITRAERYCIYAAAIGTIRRDPFSPIALIRLLTLRRLCPLHQAAQIVYNPRNVIYESGLVRITGLSRPVLEMRSIFVNKLLSLEIKQPEAQKEQPVETKPEPKEKLTDSPLSICNAVDPYVISQQAAKEGLATAVYEHFLRCRLAEKNNDKLDKVNVLIWGPTGTGKTYLCRTLAKLLKMPFYMADASQLTDTGYVGLSVDSVLEGLAGRVKNMKETDTKFPPSIIYFDEVDKIASIGRSDGPDVSGKKVQEELLKLLEADTYTIQPNHIARKPSKTYDISNVLFIASGAFEGLDEIVAKRSGGGMGFISKAKTANTRTAATTDDLVEYGLMPELLGRFTKWLQLEALTEQNLIDILCKSEDSPITQYKKVFKEAGIELIVPDKTLHHIAQQALKKGTGARGLKNVMSNLLGQALFTCKKEGKKSFTVQPPQD
jgi:ATP-dependent Clp protease ATP-binding subunit ClpX